MKMYAVLTGDIIGSSDLGADGLAAAVARLRGIAGEFEQAYAEALVGQPDVFRGDSWQLCLQVPALAVTTAVFVRAGLRAAGFDTRVGIGLGTAERVNPNRISESSGPAFVRSGRALDQLGKEQCLALAANDGDTADAGAAASGLRAALRLLDAHFAGWTQRESIAVYGSLRKLSQAAIAELPQARTKEGTAPTRQAVQDALARVQWSTHLQPFLDEAQEILEGAIINRWQAT